MSDKIRDKKMSAFIVDNSTISKVVDAIIAVENHNQLSNPLSLSKVDTSRFTKLGRELLALNYASIEQRYGDKPSKAAIKAYKYEATGLDAKLPADAAMLFKAMRCYLYQACEGNCSQTALYIAVDKAAETFKAMTNFSTADYDKATWG